MIQKKRVNEVPSNQPRRCKNETGNRSSLEGSPRMGLKGRESQFEGTEKKGIRSASSTSVGYPDFPF